jgi:large subunit ribosomal protein L2
MAIQQMKPTSPARRQMTSQDFSEITTSKSVKKLKTIKKGSVGRNNQGRITVRHRGSGVRRFYRQVNFQMTNGTVAKVEAIEYDPNRSARIARVRDGDGNLHYIIAALDMRVGQQIECGDDASVETGNRLPLKNIPVGSAIFGIELQPGRGAQLVRSAGNGAQLVAKEDIWAQVKLPSGEVRMISVECYASIGSVSNAQHQNIKLGKAGRSRKMGRRPSVRGVVMNAVDHPHGGGDGGRHRMAKAPRTPWGQKTLGFKTRHRRLVSNRFIVKSRHQTKRKG